MSHNIFTRIAQVGKYFVPKSLRPRLREEYSYIVRSIYNKRAKKQMVGYLKDGGSYIDWYAEALDTDASNNRGNQDKAAVKASWMETGVEDLKAAIVLGLKPNHTFHEFGCGELRSANHFIRYLEGGNYSANDASGERIASGKELLKKILGEEILKQKNPQFIVNTDNSFDWMNGRKADFIWSGAVLPHMPEEDIVTFFDNVKKIMHEKTVFLFTYSSADIDSFRQWAEASEEERNAGIREVAKENNVMYLVRMIKAGRKKDEDCIEVSVKDWFHTFEFYRKILEPRGYILEDASHVLPKEQCNSFPMWVRLAKVTLRAC